MSNTLTNIHRVVMRDSVTHVVRMNTGGNQVTIRQQAYPKIHVVSVGVQGPVGTVAEAVLTMAKQATETANQALQQVDAVNKEQSNMVGGMTDTIDHYIGAISAQE